MRTVVTDRVASPVRRSVCLSVTLLSPAQTAEPIEMPFGLMTRVGSRNHVLDGDQITPWEAAVLRESGGMGGPLTFEDEGRPIVKYMDALP